MKNREKGGMRKQDQHLNERTTQGWPLTVFPCRENPQPIIKSIVERTENYVKEVSECRPNRELLSHGLLHIRNFRFVAKSKKCQCFFFSITVNFVMNCRKQMHIFRVELQISKYLNIIEHMLYTYLQFFQQTVEGLHISEIGKIKENSVHV